MKNCYNIPIFLLCAFFDVMLIVCFSDMCIIGDKHNFWYQFFLTIMILIIVIRCAFVSSFYSILFEKNKKFK